MLRRVIIMFAKVAAPLLRAVSSRADQLAPHIVAIHKAMPAAVRVYLPSANRRANGGHSICVKHTRVLCDGNEVGSVSRTLEEIASR